MLPRSLFRLAAPMLGFCLMALGGCASTQAARFYILSAQPGGGTASAVAAAERNLTIGIGPVTLPKYLDRPQIVTSTSPYTLNVAEFDRWAEPLESNLVRVLAENLALLIPTAHVVLFPWPGSTPLDYQVTVEVSDFSGQLGGESSLVAHWSVFREERGEALGSRRSRFTQAIVQTFVSAHGLPVDVACFGVAGPVRNGRSEAVNLAWAVDARELAQALPRRAVSLLNDLEAHAYGIAMLAPEDFVTLNRGAADASGNAAVIAAGTGLGEAGLYWDGRQHRPCAGEGGHTSFAPIDPLQVELLNFLGREFGHVSWERVLSGPGLHNIYRFLRDTGRGEEPDWLTREMQQRDPAAVISQAALAGSSALCRQALDLFVALYGAEAGNVALKLMATAGVYVGGGIAPKIIRKLTDSTFMDAFVAKGRLKPLLEAIAVRIIMNDKAALLGAARFAVQQAS